MWQTRKKKSGTQNKNKKKIKMLIIKELLQWNNPPFFFPNAKGGGAVGGVDNVGRIQELCNTHEAWLHVEGHALAALTLPNAPNLVIVPCKDVLMFVWLWNSFFKFKKYI